MSLAHTSRLPAGTLDCPGVDGPPPEHYRVWGTGLLRISGVKAAAPITRRPFVLFAHASSDDTTQGGKPLYPRPAETNRDVGSAGYRPTGIPLQPRLLILVCPQAQQIVFTHWFPSHIPPLLEISLFCGIIYPLLLSLTSELNLGDMEHR